MKTKKGVAAHDEGAREGGQTPPQLLPDVHLYSSLFINHHLRILVVDPLDGSIVGANAGACRFYGYNNEEFARLAVADIVSRPAEAIPPLYSLSSPAMHGYCRHRLKNGELRDVEMRCNPVILAGRRLLCVIMSDSAGGSNTITRADNADVRANAVAALPDGPGVRRDETQADEPGGGYRVIFETASIAMMILDSDRALRLANAKFTEIFGAQPSRSQHIPALPAIVYHDDLKKAEEYLRRRMLGDPSVPATYECRFVDKDGNVRYMIVNVSPLPGTGQGIIALQDITGRKRKEEKLRENEERLRLLIERLKDHAVFMLTPEGNIGSWNEGVEKITGYRKDEVLGKNLAHFYAQETVEVHAELLAVARKGQAEWDGWWVTRDGAWFWAHVAVSGLYNDKGTIRGFAVILQDNTENRRTEELLREREELYRTLIETSPEAIVMFDTKSLILMVNQQAAELFGYENREEAFGESLYNHIVPEERQLAMEMAALQPQASVKNRCYSFLKKDGTRFMGSLSASVITNVDGKPKFYVALLTDITQQRTTEDQIRNAVAEWRATFDSLKDFVYILDPAMKITRINKACASAYRANPKELIGKRWSEVFPHSRDSVFKSHYNKVIKCRKSITEERHEPALGSYQEVTISPIFDEAEEIVGTVHVIKDITERKRINDILRSEKEAIERLAIERTRELIAARMKLEQTKRLSDIGTLAATVAHELRNPLGVIRTAAYNIKRKNQNEVLKGHLANIEKKILESDQIITNLLFYSRIKTPHHEKVRLCALLEECIASARDRFHRWNVSIEGRCEEIVNGHVAVDPLQITELFNNVINNAFESLLDKKGKIRIRGGYDGSGNMWISISDNGVGIERADLERITEPFFTKKSKGTGLGLTVCRQIVELHDGKMYIDSHKGSGTTVTISLPVNPSKDSPIAVEHKKCTDLQRHSLPPAERGK